MKDKDFVTYEYKTRSVKLRDQARVTDLYEAFGWEVADATPSTLEGVTLSLKRDRKLRHRRELLKLERQAEDVYDAILRLERSKTKGASVFAYAFGSVSALVFGGGMSLCMLSPTNVPALVGGIVLGLAGMVLCGINYLIFKKSAARKTKSVLPVIDENEEKLADLMEQGGDLLRAEYI